MSLKARLSIAIVALVVVAISAVSLLNMYYAAEVRFDDVVQRARMASQQVKTFLIHRVQFDRAPPQPPTLDEVIKLWTGLVRQDEELSAMLENTVANSRVIVEILIAGQDGHVLAASNRTRIGSKIAEPPDLTEWERKSPWRKLSEIFSGRQTDYEVMVPLGVAEQREPIFTIHVVVTSALVRDALLPQVETITLICVLSLLASMVLTVVVSNLTLRPLARISQTIDRIARGEFGKEAPAGDSETKEFAAVRTKLNVLGEQFRGAKEDAVQLRSNIEQLLERLQETVLLFDSRNHLVLAGRAAEQFLGRARWELMGRELHDLFPPGSTLGSAIQTALELRQPLRDHPVAVDRDGLPPARLLVSVEMLEGFPSHERIGTLITLRDAESRQQIQSQLDISARLAAISRLTGGVAHEIKNPLNAITVHLEILRSKLANQNSGVEPEIETIAREIMRLDRVVKTFLDFTRPVDLQMRDLPMGALLREIITLVGPASARQHVQVEFQEPPEEITIHGDRDLIKQAVLNVIANGVESMKEGGRLEVQLRRSGEECVVTIADQGPGIPPEVRDKIFNLYFSTKGKGSGIGLAVTFRVVQLHNGTIDFTTEVGKGTAFRLRFPAARKNEPSPEAAPARDKQGVAS